jgi:hypothetical protein
VKPADGMKKVVWAETRVQGGTTKVLLPKSFGVAGPFQNIPKPPEFRASGEPGLRYYRDVAVVAYKLPATDKTMRELGATVTASGGRFQLAQLTDGDLGTTALLPPDANKGFA